MPEDFTLKRYTLEVIDDDHPLAKADVRAAFYAPSNKEACNRVRDLIASMSALGMAGKYKVVRHKRVRVKCKSCCESFSETED